MKDHTVGRTFVGVRSRSRGEPSDFGNGMIYRIVVQGELTERFAGAFVGMHMEAASGQTIIKGQIADQSHLYGILDRISGLGLQLVSVQALPENARGGDNAALDSPTKNREKKTL